MTFCFITSCNTNDANSSVVGDWHSSYCTISYIDTDKGGGYVTEKEYGSIDLYMHEDHSFTWHSEEKHSTYGTWLQNGNQLKMSYEGEELVVYTIETLKSKEMVLRRDMGNGYVDYYFTKR